MTELIETVVLQTPSLAGIGLLAWYLLKRLNRCEEARDELSKEHADLRVQIATLEAAVNGGRHG